MDLFWEFIGPNVNIGNGAIVGAGSVVTKNIKLLQIVAGNPAIDKKESIKMKMKTLLVHLNMLIIHMEHHSVLLPRLEKILNDINPTLVKTKRIFDLGCGNGSIANYLTNKGWDMTGVDPSNDGIKQANLSFPDLKLFVSSTVDLSEVWQVPILISLEVIEHVYAPRDYMKNILNLLNREVLQLFLYHGCLKNLLISLFGKMDDHTAN